MTVGRLVIIHWVDSVALSAEAWTTLDEAKRQRPPQCKSIGWVVSDDKDSVSIASQVGDGQVGGGIAIPRAVIKSSVTVREPRERK